MNMYDTALALSVMVHCGYGGVVDSAAELESYSRHLLPSVGYFVTGAYPSLLTHKSEGLDRDEVIAFVIDSKSRYFDVWTDPETGYILIGASTYVDNLTDALVLADERGEVVIWDAVNGEEIYVSDHIYPAQGVGDDN